MISVQLKFVVMTKDKLSLRVFDPYEYHKDIRNESCSSGPLSCMAKIGHHTQTFQPNFFIPAQLLGTIDFYHVILLSLTMIVPGGHKVSVNQNVLASFSRTLFIWSGWNLMWWHILKLVLSTIYWNKGNNSCFTCCVKKIKTLACIWMCINGFDSILVWW